MFVLDVFDSHFPPIAGDVKIPSVVIKTIYWNFHLLI